MKAIYIYIKINMYAVGFSTKLWNHDLFAILLSYKCLKEEVGGVGKGKRPHQVMLTHLLTLAAHALAEVTFINAAMCSSHVLSWFTCSPNFVICNV